MLISLSRQELVDWASESAAFCGLELSRISTVLFAQLYSFEVSRVLDTFDLTNPIKVLEGLNSYDATGSEEQFIHPPLTGLYKKHFTSSRFLARNLINFLRSKQGKHHFDSVWEEAAKISEAHCIDEKFTNFLAYHIAFDPIAIKSASKRMTGEWLVFHKHEGINYYLSIAFHWETNEEIHKKVALACKFDNLPFKL